MRLVFAGTPEFAAVALAALAGAGHEIALVLTQPDRPAGRGQKPAQSEVKQLALRLGLEVFQPVTLKDAQAVLSTQRAQAMIVAAYGLILPRAVLSLFPEGCINIHASLLPRWRGAAPIQRALLAGDRETGICIMRMDEGLDTGPVMLRESIPIGNDDTSASLHDKLARLGGELIVRSLAQVIAGSARYDAQPTQGATYARKIAKAEASIDWREDASQIERRIRAFNPAPVCFTRLGEETLRLWKANLLTPEGGTASPGTIVASSDAGIDVQCGRGLLRITELQKSGGKRQGVADFLRGQRLAPGVVLG